MINGNISHWWTQIGMQAPRPALPGPIDVDVAIVGAGFTGLWTAYYLKQADPSLRIAVLEQRFAGFGASGRNGGWLVNSVTGGREQYVASHGRDAAQRFQLAMNETVAEVERITVEEGIDCDLVRGGELNVARSAAQLARLKSYYDAECEWQHTDVEWLDTAETQNRIKIDRAIAGVWQPHAARIHPAKLARGLAERVEAMGVKIYEGTRVTEIEPGLARTDRGAVRAERILRATEGFTAGIKSSHRDWLPMNSSMIATEPLSDSTWQQLGWDGGEVLGDFAHVYMYAQRTADNRIAFGGRGVPYRWNSATDVDGRTQSQTAETLRNLLVSFFPAAADAQIDHLWSGTLGVPRDWAATCVFDDKTGIGYAGGYVGTGVATTNLAGRTLRDLVLGNDTDLVHLPWVNHRVRRWEPEPLRWIATRIIYGAYGAADRFESASESSRTHPIAKIASLVSGR
ncbi:NAD(P)/FAD-dependent oxidoreductase [Gulosibacter hominis]|uniref:NAD(P)/FAD-dependent oxidoreductase n=1 Tax=Gulosibacter hominis TaxID=2770504 RepID=UPI0019184D39|nr:FAD-binding oxidoreductase [Gulosibacter hominis]